MGFLKSIIFCLALFASASAAAAPLCQALISNESRLIDLYTDVELKKKTSDLGFLNAVVEEIDIQFRNESLALARRLRESEAEYDVIIIGAGPHGVQAATQLAGKKVLVIDSAEWVNNTFRQMGDAMWLNSPEHADGRSDNQRPNAFFQVHDMVPRGYPLASQNRGRDVLEMNRIKRRGVDLLLKSTATEFEVFTDRRGVEMTRVFLADGTTIRGRVLTNPGGLGVPNLPSKSESTQKLVENYFARTDLARMEPIMAYEGVMERFNFLKRLGFDPRSQFKGKRVVLIGGGDSGNVFVEDLYGYGPTQMYLGPVQEYPMTVTWLGQKGSTPEEIGRADRYIGNIKKVFGPANGKTKVVAPPVLDGRHIDRIEESVENGQTVIHIYPEGSDTPFIADFCIVATGYRIEPLKMKGVSPGQIEYRNVLSFGAAIAKQAYVNGAPIPLYVFGAQVGTKFVTEIELKEKKNNNPIGFKMLMDKTTSAAQFIRALLDGSR